MARIIVKCEKLTIEGIGVSTYNNLPIYIPNLLVNEVAEIQIVHKGYQKYFGKVLKILTPCKDRVTPECRFFGVCGGCQLQHMSYESQLEFKKNYVKDLFIENDLDFPFDAIYREKRPYFYRHKVMAPIKNNQRGFYEIKSRNFTKIDNCLIENSLAQKIIRTILSLNLEDLSYIYVRVGKHIDNVLLTLVTNKEESILSNEQIENIVKIHPNIKTITQSIKKEALSGKVLGEETKILFGKGYIVDKLLDVSFKISTNSFYQVNPTQTEILYSKALEYASLKETDLVLDAYCGVGTIGLCASKKSNSVIGVEIVEQAILDAKENALLNNIDNVTFLCEDAKEYIKKSNLDFDVIFVDPPRKGCDKEFLETIMNANIKKIVYVSCDPKSLVRDLKFLKEKYNIEKVSLVDMFANTSHVETITLLQRKDIDDRLKVRFDLDNVPLVKEETKATYQEIKDFIFNKHNVKVSTLNIAQTKTKYGIIERECYNKPKDDDSRQPKCTREKEEMIVDALKHFKML